ncbi:hypothetical protein TIFTF001_030855 [Ficus carica]|uniref:Uncharacterized protein n=1 Tax=Ficus carica TaxID=3494 RepID=A0AA88J5K8_FICCA|nr:hypothetical protein TIFTF001_030855 [Ficus carica]
MVAEMKLRQRLGRESRLLPGRIRERICTTGKSHPLSRIYVSHTRWPASHGGRPLLPRRISLPATAAISRWRETFL